MKFGRMYGAKTRALLFIYRVRNIGFQSCFCGCARAQRKVCERLGHMVYVGLQGNDTESQCGGEGMKALPKAGG